MIKFAKTTGSMGQGGICGEIAFTDIFPAITQGFIAIHLMNVSWLMTLKEQ